MQTNIDIVDPILFEVIRNALSATADEMGVALRRAAYSTNIKTRLDFSCAIFDASRRVIAQSFSQPNHLGSLTHFVPRIIEEYGDDRLRPGDGVISNDGHRGGVHLNDVCLVSPVFYGDDVIAYVATIAHHVDVGGSTPGSLGLSREIFQEGIVIPPIRLVDAGHIDENVFRLIMNNVRSPRETGGDFRAQVAGVNIGARRLGQLYDKYGRATMDTVVNQLLDYTERRARAELAKLPHGLYEAEGYMDSDGVTDTPIKILVRVAVTGEKVTYDLSGSDPQRPGPLNATYAMTLSNCAYTLRALMDPDLPMNDGFYRVMQIIAPKGTVVNAQPPAAIASGWEVAFRVMETAFLAFAKAIPERLTAGSKGCLCNLAFGGMSPRSGQYFVFYEALAGGYGARYRKDGIDAIQPHVQNTENSPVEETEANYPVRIPRYALIPDSEGAGRTRGGLGLRRDYMFENHVVFSILADKAKFAPFGLDGGGPGRACHYTRNPDGDATAYPSKLSIELRPGEVFSVQMGGGGGFGPPWERDPARVLEDVVDEKISVNRAREAYGVVIDTRSWVVDVQATEAARQVLRGGVR
jgi:N-methylhydantoinase B